MALVDWFEKKVSVSGVGKNKVEKIEVAFGVTSGTGTSITLANDGVFFIKPLVTGSSLDDPFGLELVKIEMVHSMTATLATTAFIGASAFVNDESIEDQEAIGSQTNWFIDTVLTDQHIPFDKDNICPSYHSVLPDPSGSRVFVSPTIDLHGYLYAESASTRTIKSMYKYTFKRVKMTKNAYLEKLATRAYQ